MVKYKEMHNACARMVLISRRASATAARSRHFSVHTEEKAEREGEQGDLQLWTWGRSDVGQLALGDETTRKCPNQVKAILLPYFQGLAPVQGRLSPHPRVYSLPEASFSKAGAISSNRNSETVKNSEEESRGGAGNVGIACGLFHSALWQNGNLWMWGKGDGGRLGLDSEVSKYVPTLVGNTSAVRSVAMGGLHSVILTENGAVYTCGYGGFGALGHGVYQRELQPRLVEDLESEKLVHIAAGGAHSAAVSESGDVYTWGRDEGEGRLGHGNEDLMNEGVLAVPLKVQELPEPIVVVACGGFFTMALTLDGQLWSWGGNSNYELGRGDKRNDFRPKQVPNMYNNRIVQVACGGYHSTALTEDGQVLTWGHGGHGQLGHGCLSNGKVPQVVEALIDQQIVYVACGSLWTAAVTESGALYTWGKNRDYQLGIPGLLDVQTVPARVTFQPSSNQQLQAQPQVIAVCGGASHGMCLVHRRYK
ncbi:hypothetical protein O6H91_20G018700 [Diphasiastrum complanatum]|uniref:Uncharacterized protein n=1 Tax=Diphasiastrum complanatum TaxID=34168 RepID=A0ACC2APF9_DIPCM|nr:hypothetical protein O6H91_20G018700 [Diphasiastrum complanatum]